MKESDQKYFQISMISYHGSFIIQFIPYTVYNYYTKYLVLTKFMVFLPDNQSAKIQSLLLTIITIVKNRLKLLEGETEKK